VAAKDQSSVPGHIWSSSASSKSDIGRDNPSITEYLSGKPWSPVGRQSFVNVTDTTFKGTLG